MSQQPLSEENLDLAALRARARTDTVLAVAVPLVLCFVFIGLSPLSSFAWQATFLAQPSGEFFYCNAAVFWFAWRLGGEVTSREQMPRRLWLSSLVIFLVTLMLYAHAASGLLCEISNKGCSSEARDLILSRYFSYYLYYVLLAYGLIFAAVKRRGL